MTLFPPKQVTEVKDAKKLVEDLPSFEGFVDVTELPEVKQVAVIDKDVSILQKREFFQNPLIDFGGSVFSWLCGREDIEVYPSAFYTELTLALAKGEPHSSNEVVNLLSDDEDEDQAEEEDQVNSDDPEKEAKEKFDHFMTSNGKRFESIFLRKFICMPVRDGSHWRLFVLVHPGAVLSEGEDDNMCCILGLDSNNNDIAKVQSKASSIYKCLNTAWNKQFPDRAQCPFEPKTMPAFCPSVPQQPNGKDCGPFTVLAIRCMLYEMSNEPFTRSRREWIKNGASKSARTNSVYKKSYKKTDAGQLRNDMQQLINRISNENPEDNSGSSSKRGAKAPPRPQKEEPNELTAENIKTTEEPVTEEEPVAIEEPATEEERKPAAKEKYTMKELAAEEESNMEEPATEDVQAEEPATAEAHPRKQAQKKRNGPKQKASQKEDIAKASDGSSKRSSQQPPERPRKGRNGPKRNATSPGQKADMVGAAGGSSSKRKAKATSAGPKEDRVEALGGSLEQIRPQKRQHTKKKGSRYESPTSLLSPVPEAKAASPVQKKEDMVEARGGAQLELPASKADGSVQVAFQQLRAAMEAHHQARSSEGARPEVIYHEMKEASNELRAMLLGKKSKGSDDNKKAN